MPSNSTYHTGVHAAKLVLRRDQLATRKQLAGIETDDELARLAQMHRTQFSRVLNGRSEPGNKFIAGLLDVFGIGAFQDLFALVGDDDGDVAA